MGAKATESGMIAKRYAISLLDMAEKGKTVEAVEKDLADLLAMVESSEDLRALIRNPLYNREQQNKALQALAVQAKFTDLTKNFLGVIVSNRRVVLIEDIVRSFQKGLTERRGEVEAHVETAFTLTPAQTDKLQKELTKKLGSNVTLRVDVNEELLGGMVVTVGSRMIDNSVRRKLEMLQVAMNANKKAA